MKNDRAQDLPITEPRRGLVAHQNANPRLLPVCPSGNSRSVGKSPHVGLQAMKPQIVSVRLSIGIPALLIACGIAAGARLPYKIPFRDTLLYVAISVALVASIVIWASQTARRNIDIDINNRWIAFSFTAVFVFGFVAKDFRHHRRRPVFGLLSRHCWRLILQFSRTSSRRTNKSHFCWQFPCLLPRCLLCTSCWAFQVFR